jgi:hypothetical protein
MPCTTSSFPTIAGDEAIFPPGGSYFQTIAPLDMFSA